MPEILVAEEHSQVYDVWQRRGERGLALAHIDFHDDMRGLLVDRRRGRAWRIDGGDYRIRTVDSGNFLAHAVLEGVVTSVRWIHDPFGGRRYDIGTVKYESDVTALPHRLVHRLRKGSDVPFHFEELTFDRWDGTRAAEHLDIDWDGLASVDYDVAHIRRLMGEVLDRDLASPPATTYLVYSPGYSHPDRGLFDEFLARLARKLGADVSVLPPPATAPPKPAPRRLAEAVERAAVLALRRVGIY